MVDVSVLILRITVGTIFVAQGYRKLFSAPDVAYGRANLTKLIASKGYPFPTQLAFLTATVELVGGAFVLTGLFTRVAAIPLVVLLVLAVAVFKRDDGFFGGWDWPYAVLGTCIAIALLGGGAYSLDGAAIAT